ncbi:hypothetical protein Ancab_001571 [Ancistrocladus abbreviatus]
MVRRYLSMRKVSSFIRFINKQILCYGTKSGSALYGYGEQYSGSKLQPFCVVRLENISSRKGAEEGTSRVVLWVVKATGSAFILVQSGLLDGLSTTQQLSPKYAVFDICCLFGVVGKCNDKRQDSEFAVKCGGPQITSSDGTVYESDNETLGPAIDFVTNMERWAVSNVGLFISNNNPSYTWFSSSQFTNTLDSELFQTSRLSAGSLRYYGLGLQNGNYTIILQFAETIIINGQTWKSLGRRVFDIYIQGNLASKNFDIRKEAGEQSFVAVQKTFTTNVAENYLEIHLFWAGKGTCCVPQQGTYGPLISAISVTPNFEPTVSNKSPTKKKNRTGLILGIVIPVALVSLVSLVACFFIQRWKRSHLTEDEELKGVDTRPYAFSYSELRSATQDFSSANKLGEGGFGPVYKAWHLHESNQDLELVDERLQSEFNEEEVRRVIGIALLCTQTSLVQRPAMSRVISMLSGDSEVETVVSRPAYLTDLKFDDATFESNETRTSKGRNSSAGTSMPTDEDQSPLNASKFILSDIDQEGR